MRVMDTIIGKEIDKILDSTDARASSFTLDLVLNVGTYRIVPNAIHKYKLIRHYRENIADVITLIITVNRYDYDVILYPYRLDITGTLTKTSTNGNSATTNSRMKGDTSEYRVKLINPKDNNFLLGLEVGDANWKKQESLVDIAIELTDQVVEHLIGGQVSTVIKSGTAKSAIEVFTSNFGTHPINVHPTDFKGDVNNLIVPEGVSLLDFPNWLQVKGTGVYNNGINTYIQNGWVYVYPISLLEPHPKRNVINIFRLSDQEMVSITNTFCYKNSTPYIISGGVVDMIDDVEKNEGTMGNAIRWSSPNYMGERIIHKDGVTVFNGMGNNLHGIDDRRICYNRVHTLNTANNCNQISKINATQGKIVTLPWNNALPDMITPNMECIITYGTVGSTSVMKGVVIGVAYEAIRDDGAATTPNFRGQARLQCLIK